MDLGSLLDSKLLLVTGKGGTGKTTFASALSILAAVRGRKVALCELDSQLPSLPGVFGGEIDFDEREVLPNLSVSNISFSRAVEVYLQRSVPMKRLVRAILDNKLIARFLDITPGAREVVILSQVATMVDHYDLVVVDMPASGHAFSLLDILRNLLGLFRSGPVRQRAEEMREMILAPSTHMVFVSLPEEMVVNETLETLGRMRRADVIGGQPGLFLNRATLPSLTDPERELIARLGRTSLDPLQREFVRAGVWEDRLEQATAEAQERLRQDFEVQPILVPPAPHGSPRDVVADVCVHLGRGVGLTKRELPWT